jgi:hypothetical protein
MDLTQRKLDKSEWESIEVPSTDNEKEILQLMIRGFHDVNLKYNNIKSLFNYLKIEYKESMEDYLYTKYFEPWILQLRKMYAVETGTLFTISIKGKPFINSADKIRLEKNTVEKVMESGIFEYKIIEILETILKLKRAANTQWLVHYFTLYKLIRNNITLVNKHIRGIADKLLALFEDELDMFDVIGRAVEFIEKNSILLKTADLQLYDHQKELFAIMARPPEDQEDEVEGEESCCATNFAAKLILYIAPTGTGKTLSPIGLSERYKVIFICAARHVGLALAKAAISVDKKIAFAFGCSCAADIRLHYYAAKEFTKDWKTGGIRKVDNSVGDKVEIMICDVKSYLPAMLYMLAFNAPQDMIVYWDEPTISMDQSHHPLHATIQENWQKNEIPNMVLSSATLPKLHELSETIPDFMRKFPGAQVHNIVSHDCKKSIPLINKFGYAILPHYLTEDYTQLQQIVAHCEQNLSLLRYFDLTETVAFIRLVEEGAGFIPSNCTARRCFASLDDVNMLNIKLHYLKVLKRISLENWSTICTLSRNNWIKFIPSNNNIDPKGLPIKKAASVSSSLSSSGGGSCKRCGGGFGGGKPLTRMGSIQEGTVLAPALAAPIVPLTPLILDAQAGIYVTTKDAFTLTDGPTLFLATNVEKISQFCIQQAAIPEIVMTDILEKIQYNNKVNDRIAILEHDLEDICEQSKNKNSCADESKLAKKSSGGGGSKNNSAKDTSKDLENKKGVAKINQELEMLRGLIKSATLNETFIPNRAAHIKKWAEHMDTKSVFTSDIDEDTVIRIMMLTDVIDSWKVMLLLGIGVFTNHKSITYTEIMKKLADEQKLYMIIADSDYIYGTNYQFCHGYLSKDLALTQEKIIQALGRIGRNNIQQQYSVRFRDDEQIKKLFYEEQDKMEVRNMNRLFNNNI